MKHQLEHQRAFKAIAWMLFLVAGAAVFLLVRNLDGATTEFDSNKNRTLETLESDGIVPDHN